MRAVVQRVSKAVLEIDGQMISQIGNGLLVYVGVGRDDSDADAEFMAEKIAGLRIFEDAEGKMNLGLQDVGGGLLVVSNFTVYGDCRKGRRPGFDDSALPKEAERLYELMISLLRNKGVCVEMGKFGAHMNIESVNDGPVNFLLDSKRLF